jgi:hypothetical protein
MTPHNADARAYLVPIGPGPRGYDSSGRISKGERISGAELKNAPPVVGIPGGKRTAGCEPPLMFPRPKAGEWSLSGCELAGPNNPGGGAVGSPVVGVDSGTCRDGAGSPGGARTVVEAKPWEGTPPAPGMEPFTEVALGLDAAGVERTPSGFLEKLSRTPPFVLFDSERPYNSVSALVA